MNCILQLNSKLGRKFWVEVTDRLPEDWDPWIARFSVSNYLQSSVFVGFESRVRSGKALYITAYFPDKGEIVGRLLAFVEALRCDFFLESDFRRSFLPLFNRLPRRLFWIDGPVLDEALALDEALYVFLKAIDRVSKKWNVYTISHASLPHYADCPGSGEAESILRDFGYEAEPWLSYVIDLDQDEETLWKSLKQDARNKVRKAKGRKLRFTEVEDGESLKKYYSIFLQHRRRNRLNVTFGFHHLCDLFFSDREGIRYFLVLDGEHPVAGQGGYIFHKTMHRVMSAVSDYSVLNRVYGGELLQWEIIRWARENGLKRYDLAGAADHPKTSKEENIKAFKSKFGGQEISYRLFYKKRLGWLAEIKRLTTYGLFCGVRVLTTFYDRGIYSEHGTHPRERQG